MAYGTSRRRRERDPDIRDVVEDAARDAGLSIKEFIAAAAAEHEADARSRHAPQRSLRLVSESDSALDILERRLTGGQDETSEDRIAGILGKAFDEIKASEQRTARLIEQIATLTPAANSEPPRTVADILASAERRSGVVANVLELSGRNAPRQPTPALVDRLQRSNSRQEVETALGLLERKLAMIRPESSADRVILDGMSAEIAGLRSVVLAEGADVPLAAIEGPVASLVARLERLATTPQQAAPTPGPVGVASLERRLDEVTSATTAMVTGIQDELVRLGRNGLKRDDAGVDASFGRLENRIHQLEQASEAPLDQIRNDLRGLLASAGRTGGDPALRDAVSGIEKKLDQIVGRIAQPLQMVHNAVTQLSRQRGVAGPDQQRLDQLFGELAALKRGIAAQSTLPDVRVLARTVASISDRIDGIAHRMQQDAQPDGERDLRRALIDEELEEIKELLREAKSPCDDTRVLDAIGQLERKIAALENSPRAVMERLDRLQARLDERPPGGGLPANIDLLLRNISARLEATAAAPAASGPDPLAFADLHREIRGISGKLERMPAAPSSFADDAALARLHDEIRDLSGKFERMPPVGAAPAQQQDFSHVERSIGDILRQMDGLKADVGSQAARAAADAVRQFGPAVAAAPLPPPSDTTHIEAAIGQLRQHQADAEERTNRTLEALHDTLHQVVDRLGSMERDTRAPAPAIAAPMPATATGVVEAAVVPAPVIVPAQAPAPAPEPPRHPAFVAQDVSNLLPQDILAPAPAAPPAASPKTESFAETLANLRAAQTAKPAPVEQRSAMASAFAAAKEAMANLRGGQPDDGKPVAPAVEPSFEVPPQTRSTQQSPDFDLPIEPGAGRPASAPMRSPAPHAAASGGAATSTADPKAEFLAAARRAAQSAAQQAAEPASEGKKGIGRLWKSGSQTTSEATPASAAIAAGASPKGSGFRAKHAALLGTAALVVVVGAGYQFLGPQRKAEAPASPPARTSSIVPPAAQQPLQTATAPVRQQQAEAPRQILPPPLPTEAPRIEMQPTRIAPRDEQVTVGSITPDRVPNAAVAPVDRNDPLFRFEGLKDAPKLREAALKGDPNAFLELGQRYGDGRGAPRDFKTAALWLERAAENGSAPAQYRLGSMYREGKGVERNAKTALKHFQASAEAGNARGMHNTAVLLAEGVNGAPDYAAAAEWFRKAAEHGVKDSQYNLAILHARGLGVGQDLSSSYAWFAAAANHGDEDAAKKRDEVGSRMTPERLQQARAAAQAWKPKDPSPTANEGVAPTGGWDSEAKAQSPAAAPKTQPRRI
jgi:localization factor PodJL